MPHGPPPPPSPPLKGFVIITLPPPDDPSQTKTITAFTVTPDTLPASPPPPSRAPRPEPLLPRPARLRRFRRTFAWFAVAAFAVVAAWACLSSEAPLDLLRTAEEQEGEKERESFLFRLYEKGPEGGRLSGRRLSEAGIRAEGFGWRRRRDVVRQAGTGRNESSVAFSVLGNVFPDGIYYTIFYVGNPPRPYYLDVDTGSDLTWIQCDAPCSSCAKGPNPLYKPKPGKIVPPSDSICREMQNILNIEHCASCQQCDYEIEYADHSSSMGVLVKDSLPLKMMNKEIVQPAFIFGCAYDQQGQLSSSPASTDGILGLGSAKIGLPSQLASQNIIINVVGHCISHKVDASGYLFLGDDFVPRWGMTWVPVSGTAGRHYEAEAQKISYGQKQIDQGGTNNMGTVIFDSGSSYSYFTDDAYGGLISVLRDGLEGLVEDESDLTLPICWKADVPIRSFEEVNQIFKPITLHFGSTWVFLSRTYVISPEGYLIINERGNVCLGILNGTEVGMTNILGDISLRGQLVVYDNVKGKIGWVQSDCMNPERKTPFPFLF